MVSSPRGCRSSARGSGSTSRDLSQLLWVGAVPGDIPEIVVYCHIFGAAKQLHTAVMSAICDPETGEFPVRYDVQANLPILEDKVGAVL
uniref:Uncharacterized protein n=1 Tax=Oryza punctata TaxID=4537 RepID=A0A0E0MEM3_ORYPU